MKRIPRRIFTEEFKKETVHLIKEQGLTVAEVSHNLEIAPKSLRTWLSQYDTGSLKGSLGVDRL